MVFFQTIASILLISWIVMLSTEAFVVVLPGSSETHRRFRLCMEKDNAGSKGAYRFGDLTRGVLKKVRGGDESPQNSKAGGYRFGDLTRGVLQKAGVSTSEYKFGDVSRWLDKKAKEQVSKFTKKENYQFGDMSKEVLRRLVSGEYSRDDLWLFLRIVVTIGINLQPVTRVLPLKVLNDLLNMTMEASIAQTVGEKVISSITNEIDGRMKELVTGDRNYKVGDLTTRALLKWTGKDEYEFGDITKTFFEKRDAASEKDASNAAEESLELFSSKSEKDLLEEWDEKLLKSRREENGMGDMNDDESYREWDEKFLSS